MSTLAVTAFHGSGAHGRLRITKRGRTVLLVLAAAPIAVLVALSALSGGQASAGLTDGAPIVYTLASPGESLWDVASRIAPMSDPRDVIDDLVAFNALPSADVMAGQQLGIPPKYLP